MKLQAWWPSLGNLHGPRKKRKKYHGFCDLFTVIHLFIPFSMACPFKSSEKAKSILHHSPLTWVVNNCGGPFGYFFCNSFRFVRTISSIRQNRPESFCRHCNSGFWQATRHLSQSFQHPYSLYLERHPRHGNLSWNQVAMKQVRIVQAACWVLPAEQRHLVALHRSSGNFARIHQWEEF